MNDTVTGLILSQSDYRDHDVLLRVLTKEYGLIGFIAAGARKMTSKNAGSIQPVTKAEIQFDYKEGRTLFRLKTARTREFYRFIHQDLTASSASAVLCEVCASLSPQQGEPSAKEYDLLEQALTYLNEGKDAAAVLSLYITDMMDLFGIVPDVDECVRCGSTTVAALSAEDGGFLCADCASKQGIPLYEVSDLRRFRLLVKGGLKHFEMIEKAGGAKMADLALLIEMMRLHAGLELRSFAFFRRIMPLE